MRQFAVLHSIAVHERVAPPSSEMRVPRLWVVPPLDRVHIVWHGLGKFFRHLPLPLRACEVAQHRDRILDEELVPNPAPAPANDVVGEYVNAILAVVRLVELIRYRAEAQVQAGIVAELLDIICGFQHFRLQPYVLFPECVRIHSHFSLIKLTAITMTATATTAPSMMSGCFRMNSNCVQWMQSLIICFIFHSSYLL